MSKGDWRRPSQVPPEQYDKNFEEAFGKKEFVKTWDPSKDPDLNPDGSRKDEDTEESDGTG